MTVHLSHLILNVIMEYQFHNFPLDVYYESQIHGPTFQEFLKYV